MQSPGQRDANSGQSTTLTLGNRDGRADSFSLFGPIHGFPGALTSNTSTFGTPRRARKKLVRVSSLMSPLVPRCTTTASPSRPCSRRACTTGTMSTICRLTWASTVMPSSASAPAAPSITESPMASVLIGSAGAVVVGGVVVVGAVDAVVVRGGPTTAPGTLDAGGSFAATVV